MPATPSPSFGPWKPQGEADRLGHPPKSLPALAAALVLSRGNHRGRLTGYVNFTGISRASATWMLPKKGGWNAPWLPAPALGCGAHPSWPRCSPRPGAVLAPAQFHPQRRPAASTASPPDHQPPTEEDEVCYISPLGAQLRIFPKMEGEPSPKCPPGIQQDTAQQRAINTRQRKAPAAPNSAEVRQHPQEEDVACYSSAP